MIKRWIQTLVLKCTHRLWNRQISRILCRAYGDRLITSYELHELTAAFDPTQKHKVYGKGANTGFKTLTEEYKGQSTTFRRS